MLLLEWASGSAGVSLGALLLLWRTNNTCRKWESHPERCAHTHASHFDERWFPCGIGPDGGETPSVKSQGQAGGCNWQDWGRSPGADFSESLSLLSRPTHHQRWQHLFHISLFVLCTNQVNVVPSQPSPHPRSATVPHLCNHHTCLNAWSKLSPWQ